MKRQKRKTAAKKARNAATAPKAIDAGNKRNRRDVLRILGYSGLGLGVVAGGGWYFASSLQASIREGDLSRIGNGVPIVVQIHDLQCPQCQALQREAPDALSEFEDGKLQYLVAINRA